MPGHLPDAVEGRIQEPPVDQLHQSQVHLRLTQWPNDEREIDRRRHCAPIDSTGWSRSIIPFSIVSRTNGVLMPHHLPVHGLSFREKKSLATASSPILACNDRIVSSFTSAGFRLPRSKMSAAPSSKAFFH